jgi:hypothetical protein
MPSVDRGCDAVAPQNPGGLKRRGNIRFDPRSPSKAVLELPSRWCRRVVITPKTVAEIGRIRRQQTITPTDAQEVITA